MPQTITFTPPTIVQNIQSQVNQFPSNLNSQTVQANKVLIGGVQIINSPNRVFQAL